MSDLDSLVTVFREAAQGIAAPPVMVTLLPEPAPPVVVQCPPPRPWVFTVQRGPDGLIDTIVAEPYGSTPA